MSRLVSELNSLPQNYYLSSQRRMQSEASLPMISSLISAGSISFSIFLSELQFPFFIPYQYYTMAETPSSPSDPSKPHQSDTAREDAEMRSEFFYESRCQGTMTTSELLDSIEEQIGEIEVKLKKIKQEKATISSGSQQYADLEDKRRLLKKELIDLDYQHNLYCDKLKAEQLQTKSQSKSVEKEKDSKRKEEVEAKKGGQSQERSPYQSYYLQYSRRVEEELQKIQNTGRERTEQVEKESISGGEKKRQQPAETVQKTEVELERELIEARYLARVTELQLQMASQSLRRSREAELEAELSALRLESVPRYEFSSDSYLSDYSVSGLRGYLGLYPGYSLL